MDAGRWLANGGVSSRPHQLRGHEFAIADTQYEMGILMFRDNAFDDIIAKGLVDNVINEDEEVDNAAVDLPKWMRGDG